MTQRIRRVRQNIAKLKSGLDRAILYYDDIIYPRIRSPLLKAHKTVSFLSPWGIVLTLLGLFFALLGFMLELEDRQSERVFRAWEAILVATERTRSSAPDEVFSYKSGTQIRGALEYLNRRFDGAGCFAWVNILSIGLSGNSTRGCIFPEKVRESFSSIYMPYSDLQRVLLPHAHLPNAMLKGSNLRFAKLPGANLMSSQLQQTDFTGADLRCANLRGSTLQSNRSDPYFLTTLRNVDLRYSDLRNTNLKGVDLRKANLRGADMRNSEWDYSPGFEYVGSKVAGADMQEADLTGVKGLRCEQLETTKNWETSYRSEDLECSGGRPVRTSREIERKKRAFCAANIVD